MQEQRQQSFPLLDLPTEIIARIVQRAYASQVTWMTAHGNFNCNGELGVDAILEVAEWRTPLLPPRAWLCRVCKLFRDVVQSTETWLALLRHIFAYWQASRPVGAPFHPYTAHTAQRLLFHMRHVHFGGDTGVMMRHTDTKRLLLEIATRSPPEIVVLQAFYPVWAAKYEGIKWLHDQKSPVRAWFLSTSRTRSAYGVLANECQAQTSLWLRDFVSAVLATDYAHATFEIIYTFVLLNACTFSGTCPVRVCAHMPNFYGLLRCLHYHKALWGTNAYPANNLDVFRGQFSIGIHFEEVVANDNAMLYLLYLHDHCTRAQLISSSKSMCAVFMCDLSSLSSFEHLYFRALWAWRAYMPTESVDILFHDFYVYSATTPCLDIIVGLALDAMLRPSAEWLATHGAERDPLRTEWLRIHHMITSAGKVQLTRRVIAKR